MSDEALLQEANDPNTPSKKLAELTSAYDVTLARAAMRNPNLPRESLFSMAHKYPREFVENPALPLFLLEKSDPNELKAKTIKAIAQQPGIEHDIIETLLSICSDAMQAQIASSKVPERTLRFLMRAGSEKVRRAVAENANAGALLQELSTDEALQLSVAKNQSASLELLDTLSYLGEHIQMGVAQNPKTTTNILVRLADVSSTSTRRLVARHPNTPPESLTLLSNDSAQSVVEEVAKNPKHPAQCCGVIIQR